MKLSAKLAISAALLAMAAPAATAAVSSAKGKQICKEAGTSEVPGGKVRVNPRDIRSTDTAYIYQVRLTDADGGRKEVVCVVDKESGEATLQDAE